MANSPHTSRWTTRRLSPGGPQGRRLLVVDDYRPGGEAITASLMIAGYEAVYMLDGASALNMIATWVPDIAVLDINMPQMDGYTLARHLRQNTATGHTVLIAFTALDESVARPAGVASGFDAYCQKGGAPDPLLRLLEKIRQ
ncbi:response regulator [Caballeronia temeraria]|nr:response regulator [Caballeronia temeraria]